MATTHENRTRKRFGSFAYAASDGRPSKRRPLAKEHRCRRNNFTVLGRRWHKITFVTFILSDFVGLRQVIGSPDTRAQRSEPRRYGNDGALCLVRWNDENGRLPRSTPGRRRLERANRARTRGPLGTDHHWKPCSPSLEQFGLKVSPHRFGDIQNQRAVEIGYSGTETAIEQGKFWVYAPNIVVTFFRISTPRSFLVSSRRERVVWSNLWVSVANGQAERSVWGCPGFPALGSGEIYGLRRVVKIVEPRFQARGSQRAVFHHFEKTSYSQRKATRGSTLAARRAGSRHATDATATSNSAAAL